MAKRPQYAFWLRDAAPLWRLLEGRFDTCEQLGVASGYMWFKSETFKFQDAAVLCILALSILVISASSLRCPLRVSFDGCGAGGEVSDGGTLVGNC